MSPSISISVPNDTYQLLIEYRNETGLSQSSAGAALLKMGFAWNEQHKLDEEKQKHERQEYNAIKKASIEGITKAVKTAQKPRIRVKV